MAEQRITVIGEGTARAQPTGLDLQLIIRVRAQTAGEALDLAAERGRILQEILRQHGIAETAWHTIIASVNAERRWVEARLEDTLVAYVAAGGLAVALEDPAMAGALMAEAAARVDAQINGPRWRIEPNDPAWTEARRQAVADARRRATDYAAGLGLSLGPVVAIVESAAMHHPRHGRFPVGFAALASSESSADPMELHAGGIEVAASVEVTFELLGA